MIDDSATFLIRHCDKGFACTVENALAILESYSSDNRLPDSVRKIAERLNDSSNEQVVVNCTSLAKIVSEALTVPVGNELPLLTRWLRLEQPAIQSLDAQNAMLRWGAENGYTLLTLSKNGSSDIEYDGRCNRATLPCVLSKYGSDANLVFYDGDTINVALEYNVLLKNKWKDGAKVSRVVQRYLTFINENLVHPRHDSTFEIMEIQEHWS